MYGWVKVAIHNSTAQYATALYTAEMEICIHLSCIKIIKIVYVHITLSLQSCYFFIYLLKLLY